MKYIKIATCIHDRGLLNILYWHDLTFSGGERGGIGLDAVSSGDVTEGRDVQTEVEVQKAVFPSG